MALRRANGSLILLLSILFLLGISHSLPTVHATGITHVSSQSGRGLWSTGTTFSVTMALTPTSNNLLIATIMTASSSGAARTVSSIAETNVVWTYQIRKTDTTSAKLDVEIWVGVVSASANKTLVITLSSAPGYGAIADVYEYSGLALTNFLDKTATSVGSGTALATGTTDATTVANELLIGGTAIASGGSLSQNTPTNNFTLYDGAGSSLKSLAFLEKIVSSTGAASSGTTSTQSNNWVGCIATFKAASTAYTADLTLGFSAALTSATHWVASTSESLGITGALSGAVQSVFHVADSLGFSAGLSAVVQCVFNAAETVGIVSSINSAFQSVFNVGNSLSFTVTLDALVRSIFKAVLDLGASIGLDASATWAAIVDGSIGFVATIGSSIASAFNVGLPAVIGLGLDVIWPAAYQALLGLGITIVVGVQNILNGGGGISQAQITAGYLMAGFVIVPVGVILVLYLRRR